MGCVSSKILAKSGSFQEKVSFGHSFQRSSVIEEIILSSASKSNGDQFLALLCSSNSSARKAKEPEAAEQSTAAAEPAAAKIIETINVSELLAGLEEAEQEQERRSGGRKDGEGDRAPAPCASESDGGAAGRARSFRTVEEFDALVTQQSSSSERATAPATEQGEPARSTATVSGSSHGGSTAAAAESRSSTLGTAEQGEAPEAAGMRRRARARQLGELKLPPAFDFSKSGSLRDWLRQGGGQTFSPGSYVTPKFGTAAAAVPAEQGGRRGEEAGERRQQEHDAVFDPELVAQFERAMEQLSEDEGRVLEEILEALESEAAGEEEAAFGIRERIGDQPAAVAALSHLGCFECDCKFV